MTRTFVLAAALAALPFCAAAAPANLLINPGAETGDMTGWTVFSEYGLGVAAVESRHWHRGTTAPYEGKYFFAPIGEAFPPDRGEIMMSQLVDLPGASGEATLSFRVTQGKGFFDDFAYGSFLFYDAQDKVIGVASMSNDELGGNWAEWKLSAAVPQGTSHAEVRVRYILKSGSELDAFVDNLSFYISPVPEAGAMSMTAAGLAVVGIAGMARRRRRHPA